MPKTLNAIGHVEGCKCVVCRNTDFDYIAKRRTAAISGSLHRVGRHNGDAEITCPRCGSPRARKTPKHMAEWEDEYWCDAHGGYFVPTVVFSDGGEKATPEK